MNLGGFYNSVYFVNRDTGYVAGGILSNHGVIMKTVNGGPTLVYSWYPLSNQPNAYLNSIFFPDENIGYAAGDYGSVLKTMDAGTTWSLGLSMTNNSLQAVHFTDVNTGFVVGVNGTILKTTNGGGINVGKKEVSAYTKRLKI